MRDQTASRKSIRFLAILFVIIFSMGLFVSSAAAAGTNGSASTTYWRNKTDLGWSGIGTESNPYSFTILNDLVASDAYATAPGDFWPGRGLADFYVTWPGTDSEGNLLYQWTFDTSDRAGDVLSVSMSSLFKIYPYVATNYSSETGLRFATAYHGVLTESAYATTSDGAYANVTIPALWKDFELKLEVCEASENTLQPGDTVTVTYYGGSLPEVNLGQSYSNNGSIDFSTTDSKVEYSENFVVDSDGYIELRDLPSGGNYTVEQAAIVSDATSGISAACSSASLEGVTLSVTSDISSTQANLISTAVGEGNTLLGSYALALANGDGVVDSMSGIKVSFPVDTQYNGMYLKVIQLDDNGTTTETYVTVKNGTASITVDSLSTFALVIPYFDLADCTISASDMTYTGVALEPVAVKVGDLVFYQDTGFTVTYSNNITVGTATYQLVGAGNLKGVTTSGTFTISPAKMSTVKIKWPTTTGSLATYQIPYIGSALTPIPIVSIGTNVFKEGVDYVVVSYADNLNAGTATVTFAAVEGEDKNLCGTTTATFKIGRVTLTDLDIPAISTQIYTGSAIEPEVTVGYDTDGDGIDDLTLTEYNPVTGVGDYTVTYSNNTNAGTASVRIEAVKEDGTLYDYTGNYQWYKTLKFKIAYDITESTLSGFDSSYTYTGSEIVPQPTITYEGTKLVLGTDYAITYSNNTDIGSATMTITGIGDYTGTITEDFEITTVPVDSSEITVSSLDDQTYTGSALVPIPVLTDASGNILLEGTDYTVSYTDNTNVGQATVTITGSGHYSGVRTETFAIGYDISAVALVSAVPNQTYTGLAITPKPLISNGITPLVEGIDYTISYSGNVNAGTATMTIVGIGDFVGVATQTFSIDQASLTSVSVSGISSKYVYTGSYIKPSVTVKLGGRMLSMSDYGIVYYYNRSCGKVTVKITGKGNCTGTITKTFVIIPKAISISSVTAGRSKATVDWNVSSGAVTGYQIRYRKAGSTTWHYIYASTYTKKTIYSLTRYKKYYFQVRAYKTVGTVKYFGAWGTAKTTTIK